MQPLLSSIVTSPLVNFLRRMYVGIIKNVMSYSCYGPLRCLAPRTSSDWYRGALSDDVGGAKQRNDPKKFEIDRNH